MGVEFFLNALAVLKRWWPQLSLVGCLLFLVLWGRGCSQVNQLQARLEACEAKPPITQVQTVTITAKARQEVKVVFRDGSPCPDLVSLNESDTSVSIAQTQTAQVQTKLVHPLFEVGLVARSYGPWVLFGEGDGKLGGSAGLAFKKGAWSLDAGAGLIGPSQGAPYLGATWWFWSPK